MANPPTARPFDQGLDPSDREVFYVVISQGLPDAKVPPILMMGEGVASYMLILSPEAVLLGLRLVSAAGYQNQLNGNLLKLWFEVDPAMQDSPLFDDPGVVVAIRKRIVTTATPPRTKEKSFLLRIVNQ